MDALTQRLCSLAAEGETMLLLKQIPRLIDGEMVYHSDGVPRCTFPAFYPDKAVIKPGDSWYINSGAFIVDRFENGKPAARGGNITHVAFMMLDDIGTKSKIPPIKPSWIMETSEGSFQWGYIFKVQPSKFEFSAAIKAIAAAGYTDPGAINAVRNCRLPGSINLKLGRNNFAARLIEENYDLEYTLEEICEALQVTPGPADSADFVSMRIKDTGNDTVLAWLNENGHVFAPANNEGWVAVQCPNAESHSDGNPEARYLPQTRGFHCFHGGCQHLDSKFFCDWVAEQGGPRTKPGLRDDILTRATAGLSKLTPTDAFPDPIEQEKAIRSRYDGAGDSGNAGAFADMWRGKLLHISETDDILQFDEVSGWLKTAGEKTAIAASEAVVRRMSSDAWLVSDTTFRDSLLKRVTMSCSLPRLQAMAKVGFSRPGMWVSLTDFDDNPLQLGVKNGILRLDSRELLQPTPDILVSKRARVAYDPAAVCPQFDAFLAEVQPEADVRRLLQQLAGLCLYGLPGGQQLFFMFGLGANGKSTFMELLAWLLEDYAAAIQTELLMGGRRDSQAASPDLMRLKGARLAYCNETGEGRHLDTNLVKQLTGNDTLIARPLHGDIVSFSPSHCLVMTGNHRPIVRETGEGVWRRLLMIGWPTTIPEERRDPDLLAKLKTEGGGVLNWALAGLEDYLSTKRLYIPTSVRDATAGYRSEQDIVGSWLEEEMVLEPEARIGIKLAYDEYKTWAQDNGHRPMTKNSLTRKLEERGILRGGQGKSFYLGIKRRVDDTEAFAQLAKRAS